MRRGIPNFNSWTRPKSWHQAQISHPHLSELSRLSCRETKGNTSQTRRSVIAFASSTQPSGVARSRIFKLKTAFVAITSRDLNTVCFRCSFRYGSVDARISSAFSRLSPAQQVALMLNSKTLVPQFRPLLLQILSLGTKKLVLGAILVPGFIQCRLKDANWDLKCET